MMHYTALGTLAAAIVLEVIGSAFLVKSEQFSKIVPTILMVIFYTCSFYLLSLTLRSVPLGIAYAIWSGVGLVLTATVGFVFFGQAIDLAAIFGIGLIMSGAIIINVFSNSFTH